MEIFMLFFLTTSQTVERTQAQAQAHKERHQAREWKILRRKEMAQISNDNVIVGSLFHLHE